jgi:hypothetical protein
MGAMFLYLQPTFIYCKTCTVHGGLQQLKNDKLLTAEIYIDKD